MDELKINNNIRSFPFTYDERDNSVTVIITTEERVFRRTNYGKPYWEVLTISNEAIDFSRLNLGAPVLKSHDTSLDSVIGVVESARIENRQAVAKIRFSNREDVKPIVQDIKEGVLRNVSVGYTIEEFEKTGEEDDIPVILATKWTPYEISLVSIPADKYAQVRSMDECPTNTKETIMENTEIKEEVRSVEPQVDPVALIAQERSRIADITKTVRAANLSIEFAEDLIGKGASVEEARSLILDEVIKRQPKVTNTTTVTVDSSDKFRAGVTNAIEMRAGFAKDDRTNEFRGETMLEVAKRSLMNDGKSVTGDKNTIVSRAFVSTSDFPYILANLANKYLKKGYEESESTWEKWTSVVSVSDFNP